MDWLTNPAHPFAGIAEKLKRAKENIGNLYAETDRFFQECDYPVIPQDDTQALLEAIQYHKNLVIPLRFSVLSGEINHQFRACFDHIVWHFSSGSLTNIRNIREIEFPVFQHRPANHDQRALFKRKIQGVTDPNARALIEQLQPYNAIDATDSPLWIIHNFDIVDKHRELLLCFGSGAIILPRDMQGVLATYQREHPELTPAQVARYFKSNGPLVATVAFKNFGRREVMSVSEGLIELFTYTVESVNKFASI